MASGERPPWSSPGARAGWFCGTSISTGLRRRRQNARSWEPLFKPSWWTAANGRRSTALQTRHNFGLLLSRQKVKKDIGDVTILVNNVGVITAADFLSTQDHQIERMFEVNILGHMWTTRAFLPVMMNNNYGHIVTVASAAGHFVTPFMVAYCSSKFAAVGFHKALTEELSALGKNGIKTTCLCPVFINTGFVKNPSTRLGKILEIEEVVQALMEGIVTNHKMVFIPPQLNIALLSEMHTAFRACNTHLHLYNIETSWILQQYCSSHTAHRYLALELS
ncbi:estradiol 17-beta-dehydrogenase 11-like isoform X4 [Haemorhous mexicanus]|uniref:estradiol 17-beta-dehydrogenase 11-like isoform X4 n=1 Tax=Haemorhous mexicanus TaxID=30427 RepID=UPI0028BD251C|nr:estradiol 17-beta-dehydrogenase 11-like isoform X4 [Haemorhous mexicanus]